MSLGVFDLIAAAEWRELTSLHSALEPISRTRVYPTQAPQSYTLCNKQGRLGQTPLQSNGNRAIHSRRVCREPAVEYVAL
jgi:hypothetical protein